MPVNARRRWGIGIGTACVTKTHQALPRWGWLVPEGLPVLLVRSVGIDGIIVRKFARQDAKSFHLPHVLIVGTKPWHIETLDFQKLPLCNFEFREQGTVEWIVLVLEDRIATQLQSARRPR